MILYTINGLRIYETRSDMPNEDWAGMAEHIVDEENEQNANLIEKIKLLAPCFDYVTDDNGVLIDVVENDVHIPEQEPPVDPVEELKAENEQLKAQLAENTAIINALLNGEV